MYLHLGQETVVFEKDIVGVFDLDKATVSAISRKYLEAAEKSGRVEVVGDDLPKSFIVCHNGGRQKVYLSQISPPTLYARSFRELR